MRLARIATPSGPKPVIQDGDVWSVITNIFVTPERTGETFPVETTTLLAPVEPVIVLGMAHNSGPADRELPPQAFAKSARTVVGPGDQIRLDPAAGAVVAEGELTVIIAKTSRNLTPEQVPGAILGWTIGNDVTATDQIPLDDKMTQSKNGDGFTPLGPWIETELPPSISASNLAIDVRVNGDNRASASTSGLARQVTDILVYLTSHLTLGPGDAVLLGSPQTAAPIAAGDTVAITIEGIGTLTNPVA